MHALRSPRDAYTRVEFNARIAGASAAELVLVCYDQLVAALAKAERAASAGNNQTKSEALTRAVSALTALQLGVDRSQPIASSLLQFYAAARKTVLDSVLRFNAPAIQTLRRDISDIAQAMRR